MSLEKTQSRSGGDRGQGRVIRVPGKGNWMLDYYAEVEGKAVRVRESSGTADEKIALARLRVKVGRARVSRDTGSGFETPLHRRVTVGELLDDLLRDMKLRQKGPAVAAGTCPKMCPNADPRNSSHFLT